MFDADSPHDMSKEEFLNWLYEHREWLFSEDIDDEYDDPDIESLPASNYTYDPNKKMSAGVVADRFGPFLCFRN